MDNEDIDSGDSSNYESGSEAEDGQFGVYNFDDNDEDEDEEFDKFNKKSNMDDDLDMRDKFELPDEKAWGKKKKQYYLSDFDDTGHTSRNQKLLEDMKLEEEEALKIQKQIYSQLDEADFNFDEFVTKDETEIEPNLEGITANLENLSHRQKLELFYKQNPEFQFIVQDFIGN